MPGSEEQLFLQGAFEVEPIETLFRQEAQDDVAVFLVDDEGPDALVRRRRSGVTGRLPWPARGWSPTSPTFRST